MGGMEKTKIIKCSECRYCISYLVSGNQNYQCLFWSKIDNKLVEIFCPQKAGCDKGKPKITSIWSTGE